MMHVEEFLKDTNKKLPREGSAGGENLTLFYRKKEERNNLTIDYFERS